MDNTAALLDKEAIRELALLYCRGVDRKDPALLRDLYAEGATDTHGNDFDGTAEDFVAFLEQSFPIMPYSGHHVYRRQPEVTRTLRLGPICGKRSHAQWPDI